MQVILIITAILGLIAGLVIPSMIIAKIDEQKWYHIVLLIILVSIISISTVCTLKEALEYDNPTPIDVYRGRTTLKVTYIDSIPQDTLVVFK